MKESIAQTFIINLILIFFGILVALYFGSINYSKAYKTKNRLITIIEKYGKYDNSSTDSDQMKEINENLVKSGYQTTTEDANKCDKFKNGEGVVMAAPAVGGRRYDYCVVEYDGGIGKYYQVIVYMKFEIPVIGGFLEFPVKGETKVLYEIIKES